MKDASKKVNHEHKQAILSKKISNLEMDEQKYLYFDNSLRVYIEQIENAKDLMKFIAWLEKNGATNKPRNYNQRTSFTQGSFFWQTYQQTIDFQPTDPVDAVSATLSNIYKYTKRAMKTYNGTNAWLTNYKMEVNNYLNIGQETFLYYLNTYRQEVATLKEQQDRIMNPEPSPIATEIRAGTLDQLRKKIPMALGCLGVSIIALPFAIDSLIKSQLIPELIQKQLESTATTCETVVCVVSALIFLAFVNSLIPKADEQNIENYKN